MSTLAEKATLRCSQYVTASSVSARNTLPFDHDAARGSLACSLATVVPLPVPDSPCSTSTQPREAALPSALMIASDTSSAVLPSTSICFVGSTAGFAGSTPFSTAIAIPAASFAPSSASRPRMSCISVFESRRNAADSLKCSITAVDVASSAARRSACEMAAFFFLGFEGSVSGCCVRKVSPHLSHATAVISHDRRALSAAPHAGQRKAHAAPRADIAVMSPGVGRRACNPCRAR